MTDLPIALTLDDLLVHSDWKARATSRGYRSLDACVVVEHVRDPGLEVVLWASWFNRTTMSQPLRQALTRAERRRVINFAREVARMRLMLAALPKDEPAAPTKWIPIVQATIELRDRAHRDIVGTDLARLNERRVRAGLIPLSVRALLAYDPTDDQVALAPTPAVR